MAWLNPTLGLLGLLGGGVLLVVACQRQSNELAASPPDSTPTPVSLSLPVPGTSYLATPIDPPRLATLTASEADAQINVRSLPTTASTSPTYGLVGEAVELQRLAEGEGGYTWYFVTFVNGESSGWVRGDFVATSVPPAVDLSANACGEDPQLAFFETPTFAIYICDDPEELRYVSTNKATRQSLVTEKVKNSQGTFIAIDGDIQYHVNEGSLAVYQVNRGDFTQLLAEPVTQYQRF